MASSNRRPGRKSLLNEMQRLVLPSTFSVGHEFLPRGALFSLVTPENIKLVLGNPSDALVEFICGEPHVPSEKTHARKIFAILLYIDLEASIESFERHQFTDEMLPIKAENIDDNCNPEFERDCQHSDALNVFHKGSIIRGTKILQPKAPTTSPPKILRPHTKLSFRRF